MQRRYLRSWIWVLLLGGFLFLQGCSKKTEGELLETTADRVTAVEEEETPQKSESDLKEENVPKTVFVYVCGEVVNPGVYELPGDGRVYQAIVLAGGLTAQADGTFVNQAEVLADGAKVYVPAAGETFEQSESEQGASNSGMSGKVNLNKASKEELMTLTGIGEAKAEAIIKYRETHGNFGSIEDLKNIEGIKDGVFNKVKEKIMV